MNVTHEFDPEILAAYERGDILEEQRLILRRLDAEEAEFAERLLRALSPSHPRAAAIEDLLREKDASDRFVNYPEAVNYRFDPRWLAESCVPGMLRHQRALAEKIVALAESENEPEAPTRRPYTSPTEDAAAIRTELRARHGWTSRQISVRASSYSMGSSIRVEIRAPGIPLPTVREIATRIGERIDRCPITGEILSGANRYVHVEMADSLVDTAAAPYLAQLAALPIGSIGCAEYPFTAGDRRYLVGRRSEHRYTFHEANGMPIPHDTARGIARSLALESLGAN